MLLPAASSLPRSVYGVDFSAAAADAGTKTWVARGTAGGDGGLTIDGVDPLVEFLGLDTADRETALPALAAWIRDRSDEAVVGLDVPFGLPAFIVRDAGHDSWRSFISEFPDGFVDGDVGDAEGPVRAFAQRCVELTGAHGEGTYAKRETDAAVGARSPYGFIADTIAFYGMREVLAPIADDARIMPMDAGRDAVPNGPTVVETYPAAVFDRLGLCRTGYKGSGEAERTRRRRNAAGLTDGSVAPASGAVSYRSADETVETLVADSNGDALDAVAACVGAYGALVAGFETDADADPEAVAREGYIFA